MLRRILRSSIVWAILITSRMTTTFAIKWTWKTIPSVNWHPQITGIIPLPTSMIRNNLIWKRLRCKDYSMSGFKNNSKSLMGKSQQKSSSPTTFLKWMVRDQWRSCKLPTNRISLLNRITISKREPSPRTFSPIKFGDPKAWTNKMTAFQWCWGLLPKSITKLLTMSKEDNTWRDSPKLWPSRRTWDPSIF